MKNGFSRVQPHWMVVLILGSLVFSCDKNPSKGIPANTMMDIDGNIYDIVQIGEQWWMAENLRVTHYRNGDPIPSIIQDSDWTSQTEGGYCVYQNDDGLKEIYGLLYNWAVLDDARCVVPEGWHVPSEEEWMTLVAYLGGVEVAGGKLKETESGQWNDPNVGATNESGFCALPGGQRGFAGIFEGMGEYGLYWTSTQLVGDRYIVMGVYSNDPGVVIGEGFSLVTGRSVRLVRD